MYPRSNKLVCFSLAGSVAFHGLLLFVYVNFILSRPETRKIVISNVDLIMQEKIARAKPVPERNKTLSFLKLALPQIPKIAAPEAPKIPVIDIKTPESRRKNLDLPQKLSEREGKLKTEEKLDMAASRRAVSSLKDASLDMSAERSQAALAPKIELEEVGIKKAPKLPENLSFDENSRNVVRPRDMAELNIAINRSRELASAHPRALSGIEGSITARREYVPAAAAPERLAEARQAKEVALTPSRSQPVLTASALSMNRPAALKAVEAEKKKMELTGPLSRRKILKYSAPLFPAWARERGLLEAAVSLKFYVDNSGRVLDSVTVESGSGYGALDKLAIEALRQWLFEPLYGQESKQWGIITFRFVTE